MNQLLQLPNSVLEILASRRAATPDYTFIVDDAGSLTFGEACAMIDRIAGNFAAIGMARGEPVMLMVSNRREFVLTWLGIVRGGGIVVPVNTELVGEGLRYILGAARAKLLVVEAAFLERVEGLIDQAIRLFVIDRRDGTRREAYEQLLAPATPPTVAIDPRDPYQIVFSSGTTGNPKGTLRRHGTEMRTASLAVNAGLTHRDVLMAATPLYHGIGLNFVQMAIWTGASVAIRPRFSASAFWDETRRFGATMIPHVGSVIPILLRAPVDAHDRDNPVRLSFGVGAGANWRAYEERFGLSIFEFYGTTETGLVTLNAPPGRPGSVGMRHPTMDLRLVDAKGQDVAPGDPGECIARPSDRNLPLPQYYDDEAATAASTLEGWWRTGDVLREEPDGFFYFVGRAKDTIRYRGKNIVPEDVERVIDAHPAVLECAVVAVPSPLGDDEVKACIVTRPGEKMTEQDVVAWCQGRLAAFMVPGIIQFYAELPRTGTAKIQRFLLRESDPAATWRRDSGEAAE